MVHHARNEYINTFLVYGLSVCFIVIFSSIHFITQYTEKKKPSISKTEPIVSNKIFDRNAFTEIHIEGKAYVVYDLLNHEIIASKNETTLLPLASITKVMMAVSSTLHKPKDAKIIIVPISHENKYDLGLKKGQVWSLSELLKYTLPFSSNDGAEEVALSFGDVQFFLNQMNTDAKNFGLTFYFTNPAGLDVNGQIGGRGTALDVAKLFEIARYQIPEILDATTKKRGNVKAGLEKINGIPNTNQEIENMPGAEASKTGFTDLAGGNLGIIVDVTIGHPVVIVVLGSSKEGRFRDMTLLYETLRKSIKSN